MSWLPSTGTQASATAAQPAAASSPMSGRDSPFIPRVRAPTGKTRQKPASAARAFT